MYVQGAVLVFAVAICSCLAPGADGPATPPEPKMMTAYAYVTVKAIPGAAGKEMAAYAGKMAREAIPADLFQIKPARYGIRGNATYLSDFARCINPVLHITSYSLLKRTLKPCYVIPRPAFIPHHNNTVTITSIGERINI